MVLRGPGNALTGRVCPPLLPQRSGKRRGEAFLLTVGAFLLTVKLLCLQSLKALIRRELSHCKQEKLQL